MPCVDKLEYSIVEYPSLFPKHVRILSEAVQLTIGSPCRGSVQLQMIQRPGLSVLWLSSSCNWLPAEFAQ